MFTRKMTPHPESDGNRLWDCSCGVQFWTKQSSMENLVYDDNGRIIAHCPSCEHDQEIDMIDSLPRRRYGTMHITLLVRTDDRKALREKTVLAGYGRCTDFTSWAAKVICRIPDHIQVKNILVTECSREQYEEVHRQVVMSQLQTESDNLTAASLFTALLALSLHEEGE